MQSQKVLKNKKLLQFRDKLVQINGHSPSTQPAEKLQQILNHNKIIQSDISTLIDEINQYYSKYQDKIIGASEDMLVFIKARQRILLENLEEMKRNQLDRIKYDIDLYIQYQKKVKKLAMQFSLQSTRSKNHNILQSVKILKPFNTKQIYQKIQQSTPYRLQIQRNIENFIKLGSTIRDLSQINFKQNQETKNNNSLSYFNIQQQKLRLKLKQAQYSKLFSRRIETHAQENKLKNKSVQEDTGSKIYQFMNSRQDLQNVVEYQNLNGQDENTYQNSNHKMMQISSENKLKSNKMGKGINQRQQNLMDQQVWYNYSNNSNVKRSLNFMPQRPQLEQLEGQKQKESYQAEQKTEKIRSTCILKQLENEKQKYKIKEDKKQLKKSRQKQIQNQSQYKFDGIQSHQTASNPKVKESINKFLNELKKSKNKEISLRRGKQHIKNEQISNQISSRQEYSIVGTKSNVSKLNRVKSQQTLPLNYKKSRLIISKMFQNRQSMGQSPRIKHVNEIAATASLSSVNVSRSKLRESKSGTNITSGRRGNWASILKQQQFKYNEAKRRIKD